MGSQPARYASLIGVTVGNYAVRALIGRGAVGTVYLARDCILGRQVALKVLLGSLAHNPEQVRRFQLEAQAAAPLQHHNIVALYEAGIWQGIPFIAMEYVDGEALDHFLARKGTLTWQSALHIAEQVALALTCAHDNGIVHRDVKPANILLDRQGRVRLTDFGIARAQHAGTSMPVLADFLGTPQYMSPEQCAGAPTTAQSDLFSLGVMLYELLSGRRPFEGRTSAALIRSITTDEPLRLSQCVPGLPDDVCRLVAHLLQKDPDQRPAGAAAVAARIQRLQAENGGTSALPEALNAFIRESMQPRTLAGDTPTPARRPGRGPVITVPARRKRYTRMSSTTRLTLAAMALCTAAGLAYWHWMQAQPLTHAPARLSSLTFARVSPGIWQAALPDPAWEATRIRWAGDSSALLVTLQGERGSRADGSTGLLSYDPDHLTVESVLAPQGPLLAQAVSEPARRPAMTAIPSTPEMSPWHDAVICAEFSQGEVRGVLRPWRATNRAMPTLFQIPMGAGSALQGNPWNGTGQIALAAHPNGVTYALLCSASASGAATLREYSDCTSGTASAESLLSGQSDTVDPERLQYTAGGRFLAFQTQRGGGDRQLWVVASGVAGQPPRPLAAGRLHGDAAFSRDESLAAVSLEENGRLAAYLVRVADGQILTALGGGAVDAESWHPSGQYLVLCDRSESDGVYQLWAVETRAPYRRHPLPTVDGGVQPLVAVSRDGRWAATVAHAAGGEQVIFIELSSLLFAVQA